MEESSTQNNYGTNLCRNHHTKKQAWKTFFTAKDLNEKLGEKSHQIVKQNAIDSP